MGNWALMYYWSIPSLREHCYRGLEGMVIPLKLRDGWAGRECGACLALSADAILACPLSFTEHGVRNLGWRLFRLVACLGASSLATVSGRSCVRRNRRFFVLLLIRNRG
ncbi:hypothetical protein N658DRAFT_44143 [Parathielavia hyrcaniae]|uniref:Uncharacterized protein n=1 Tax=Parathielavia hyrcaniae TaxID=113614 RepID=A0AAN6Q592_9PEZI|nr:hypothetical protein N658DRAFT_44143 [Parathielavia hyrcaniae]